MDTDIKGVVAQTEVTRGSVGAKKYVRLMRDGSLSLVDFYLAMALEGLVMTANGTVNSTGLQADGAYDVDAPDICVDVPAGTTIMVMRVEVILLHIVANEDWDIVALTSNTSPAPSTGGTGWTPRNKFGGNGGPGTGSQCTVYFANDDSNCTQIDGGSRAFAFWRERLECGVVPISSQTICNSLSTKRQWVAPNDGLPPIVAGVGGVNVHSEQGTPTAAGTHLSIEWIEFPTDWLR